MEPESAAKGGASGTSGKTHWRRRGTYSIRDSKDFLLLLFSAGWIMDDGASFSCSLSDEAKQMPEVRRIDHCEPRLKPPTCDPVQRHSLLASLWLLPLKALEGTPL